jgi:hypothetical protein
VTRHQLAASEQADAVLVFAVEAGADPAEVAQALAGRLAGHPVLRERLDLGLELGYLPNW